MKWVDFYKIMKEKKIFRFDEIKLLKIQSVSLNRWCKSGYLVKISKGVYLIKEFEEEINELAAVSVIYAPSYVSLEYALNYYNFIPDVSFGVTCITPKITREFKTRLGRFIYRHVKKELFFGYVPIEQKGRVFFIAEPEKALLDFFYFETRKRKIKDLERYRFNKEELKEKIDINKLRRYSEKYPFDVQDISKEVMKCLK